MTISAVDSASPSIKPTINALVPKVLTMNIGSRLWIISEEISISMLTKPSTHTPIGICCEGGLVGIVILESVTI